MDRYVELDLGHDYKVTFDMLCSYKNFSKVMNADAETLPEAMAAICKEEKDYFEELPWVLHGVMVLKMQQSMDNFLQETNAK